jgi:hypothetical protein
MVASLSSGGAGATASNFSVASVIRYRTPSWALSSSSSALLVVNSHFQDLLGFGTLPSVKGENSACLKRPLYMALEGEFRPFRKLQ